MRFLLSLTSPVWVQSGRIVPEKTWIFPGDEPNFSALGKFGRVVCPLSSWTASDFGERVTFIFDDCELDLERRELRRGGVLVHVEPQVFDVLVHLVRSRDRVVSKDELLQTVWHGRVVSEDTLTSRISAARRAIGESGARQGRLRTVARRGFRFCGEIEERAPPARSHAATLGNLPSETGRLIGRDRDLAEVVRLLASARLVTLTGVGGVGKTRLALRAAGVAAANYPDGVWLAELAPVADPTSIGHAVAGALGIALQPGKTIGQSIVQSLAGRRMLLVLDNCEHLIEAAANLARDILANCPDVGVLATSREALVIGGEQSWPVPPLGTSAGVASSAVELFVERACAVVPGFGLDHEAAAVSDICRRLDGIPLAIELAAARIRTMTASEIRARLDDCFRFLTGGRRDAPERQRTLHATVQWSYDLLPVAERAAFARTAVFSGGFTLAAAEQVCGETSAGGMLDLLDQLVRKSLVVVERAGATVRYNLLEPIRQFAEEQLAASGERDAVRLRHAAHFAVASDIHFRTWRSPNQPAAYQWLDREICNLGVAFRFAKEHGEVDIAAGIASNIGDMARFRLREDTAFWAADIVDAARDSRHQRLAVLLTWAASSAWSLGRLREARQFGEEAVSLAGNPDFDPFVWAFTDLAMVECYEGNPDRAIELARAGAAHAADREDRFCLAMLPHFLTVGGCGGEARAIASDVVAETTKTGIPSSIAVALWAKGEAFAETAPAEALRAYVQAMAVARDSGNRFWEILTIPTVAALQAGSGDRAAALRSFEEMLEGSMRSADLIFMSHGLGRLIVLFERIGFAEAAATLHGALRRHFQSNSFVPELPDTLSHARNMIGNAEFDVAVARGTAMALHQATAYALAQVRKALAVSTASLTAANV
jgi:predicted ATPase/DNA-binding winged helix-turn-helix (wHTH) protein